MLEIGDCLMLRLWLLGAAVFLSLSHGAAAQTKDPGSNVLRPVIENNQVRVYEAIFKPGAKLPARAYPNHMIYMLTEGTLVFEQAGHTGYEMTVKAGEGQWFPAQTRAMENDSDKEVRILIVEVKDAAVAAKKVAKSRGKARRKRR
jgi:quercetin dioxygenase-like cupin family protein